MNESHCEIVEKRCLSERLRFFLLQYLCRSSNKQTNNVTSIAQYLLSTRTTRCACDVILLLLLLLAPTRLMRADARFYEEIIMKNANFRNLFGEFNILCATINTLAVGFTHQKQQTEETKT